MGIDKDKMAYLITDGMGYLWRPNGAGYTANLVEAGLYTKDDAERTQRSTHGEHKAILLADYIEDRRINHDVVYLLADDRIKALEAGIRDFLESGPNWDATTSPDIHLERSKARNMLRELVK